MKNIYLDSVNGNNTNTGLSWVQAYKAYDTAYAQVAAGDVLNVRAGEYTTVHASVFPVLNHSIRPYYQSSGTITTVDKSTQTSTISYNNQTVFFTPWNCPENSYLNRFSIWGYQSTGTPTIRLIIGTKIGSSYFVKWIGDEIAISALSMTRYELITADIPYVTANDYYMLEIVGAVIFGVNNTWSGNHPSESTNLAIGDEIPQMGTGSSYAPSAYIQTDAVGTTLSGDDVEDHTANLDNRPYMPYRDSTNTIAHMIMKEYVVHQKAKLTSFIVKANEPEDLESYVSYMQLRVVTLANGVYTVKWAGEKINVVGNSIGNYELVTTDEPIMESTDYLMVTYRIGACLVQVNPNDGCTIGIYVSHDSVFHTEDGIGTAVNTTYYSSLLPCAAKMTVEYYDPTGRQVIITKV